jgi:Tfp pilus assembly protein PilN
MRAVNLLPEHERQGGAPVVTTPAVTIAASALAVILVIVLAVVYISDRGTVSDKRETLTAIEQKIVDIQERTARNAAAQSVDQARLQAFTAAAAGRVPWDVLLDDISRVLPAGSWLSSLNAQGGAAAATTDPAAVPATTDPAAVPAAFTVSGTALTQNTVARVLDRLELVPMLSDVTLQSSAGTTNAYGFSMSATVRTTEVPQ